MTADDIVCMEKMEVAMVSIVRAVVIALKGGEIRVYITWLSFRVQSGDLQAHGRGQFD